MIPWWRPCPSKIHKWSRIHFYQMISCYHENHIPSFSIAFPLFQSAKSKKTPQPSQRGSARRSGPSSDPPRQSSSHTSACPRRSLLWKDGPVARSGHPGHFHVISKPSNKLGERVMSRAPIGGWSKKKQLIPAKFHNQKNDKEKKRTISNFFERENI